jgi:hypothetical protein
VAGIFISYRRQDSADVTGRIHEHLAARYGKDAVFVDVDSIPFGESFSEYIQQKLTERLVCLVMIGSRWLDSASADGKRQLDNPTDGCASGSRPPCAATSPSPPPGRGRTDARR